LKICKWVVCLSLAFFHRAGPVAPSKSALSVITHGSHMPYGGA
jgi:hypothetical protein